MEEVVYAQVLFNFDPDYADELEIKAGEIVQIIYEINDDWIYAKSLMINENSLIGILPKSFVQVLDIPQYLANEIFVIYLAVEDFDFYESGDLEIKKNEILVSQAEVDENWHFGYSIINPNRTGIFPKTHVKRIYLESKHYSNSSNKCEIFSGSMLPKSYDMLLVSTSDEHFNKKMQYSELNEDTKQKENNQYLCSDSFDNVNDTDERQFCVVNFDFFSNNNENHLSKI